MDNSNFDWQTEDETIWEGDSAEASPLITNRRWWTPVLVLVALLIGGIGYWQARQRVETVTEEVEVDLRSSIELVYQAAADRDMELFNSMLSGRDMGWVGTQQMLLKRDGLLDRSQFGLTLSETLPVVEQVVLSPDLFSAEITLTVPYNETTLQLPINFRKGTTHWLFAPPPDQYWGENIIRESNYLISQYPARDAELIERLIADLDDLLQQSGTVEFGYYPPERQIQLTFTTDPKVLLDIELDFSAEKLTLPTPSLIGLPIDAQGYRALFNFYAMHVYAPVYAVGVGYECCEHLLFYKAFYDWRLSVVGVRDWPLTLADRDKVLARENDFMTDLQGWHKVDLSEVNTDEWRLAYAIVDYINSSRYDMVGFNGAYMLPGQPHAATWEQWIEIILSLKSPLATNDSVDSLDKAIDAFLNRWRVSETPILLPSAVPVMACEDNFGGGVIYGYHHAENRWPIYGESADPAQYIRALPDQDGLWIGETGLQASLLRNGEMIQLPERLRYFGVHAPDGNTLAAMRVGANGQSANAQMSLIDLDNCSAESCPFDARLGQVIWSSDGRYQLVRDFANQRTTVMSNDNTLEKVIPLSPQAGMSVWVDADTVAWLDGGDKYVRSDVGSSLVEPWVAYEDFRPKLPTTPIEKPTLRIHDAGYPLSPDLKLVQVYDDVTPRYMLAFDPATDELSYVPELDDTFFLTASHNGRWIAAAAFDDENLNGRLTELILYNRETGDTYRYPYSSASRVLFPNATDDWAMIFEQEQIRLIAPEHDYLRYVLPPQASCSSAAWMERGRNAE
ncbi:MAG: hypothetical protein ACPG8W_23750 [Candidatus Promineifilaceae bacterium]